MTKKEKRDVIIFLASAVLLTAITYLRPSYEFPKKEKFVEDINKYVDFTTDSMIINLPRGRHLDHYGEISNDTFFVIYDVKSFCTQYTSCWIGPAHHLKEYEVMLVFQNQHPDAQQIFVADSTGNYNKFLHRTVSYFHFPNLKKEDNRFNEKKLLRKF